MSAALLAKLVGFLIIVWALAWMGIDLYILAQAVQEGAPRDSGGELANAVRVGSLTIIGALFLAAAMIAEEIAKFRTSRPTTTSPEQ